MARPLAEMRIAILERMQKGAAEGRVWTWSDFMDLGPHENVERMLQRLAAPTDEILASCRQTNDWAPFFAEPRVQRIARGIYYSPVQNRMTRRPTVPASEKVIDAVVSREGGRWLLPPEQAAHNLGITNLVPARLVVETDLRLRDILLGRNKIEFQIRSAKRLHWAGRPGVLVIQGLAWSKDLLGGADDQEKARIRRCISRYLTSDKGSGREAVEELRGAADLVEAWMRDEIDLAMVEAGHAPVFAPSWQDEPDGADDAETPSGPRP